MSSNISIQDLDKLLKANEEGIISLPKREIELIQKWKNGETIDKRYNSIIKLHIKNSLDEKLDNEFTSFCENAKTKSPQEILNSAYEITVKEEIKDSLKSMDLYPLEVSDLLKQKDILSEFYHDWLNVDTPLSEVLENSIQESLAMVTRYYKSNSKER